MTRAYMHICYALPELASIKLHSNYQVSGYEIQLIP